MPSSPVGNSKSSGTTVPVRVVVIELEWLQLGVTRSSWLPSLSPGASSPGDALPHLNARDLPLMWSNAGSRAGTRRSPPYFLELEIDLPEATPCDLLVQYIYQGNRADKRLA